MKDFSLATWVSNVEEKNYLHDLSRKVLFSKLEKLQVGTLIIEEASEVYTFRGNQNSKVGAVTLKILHPAFYTKALFEGSVGVGEAYMAGYFTCDALADLSRLMVLNIDLLSHLESGLARAADTFFKVAHWFRANTLTGSQRNIQAHYDLGNEFFKLFLDETMMYSAAIFEKSSSTLKDASIAKIDRICQKLELSPQDHLLEIGSGWGGFAIHAAKNYGCRVTTTTISTQQYEFAVEKIKQKGLQKKITVLKEDYRQLRGQYDKLVSIEMIEAVGHHFLNDYFSCCDKLLKPEGRMVLQAIIIADQYYEKARDSVDFIKRYIFPGSCIPSLHSITESLGKASNLHIFHLEDITEHYATTLKQWRERLLAHADEVKKLGHPDSFLRMWEFYFAICEGAFAEHYMRDLQIILTKASCRRNLA